MKKSNLMTTVSSTFNKAAFQIKKHNHEILIVAGVVGTVASAVLACKATTKVSTILEQSKEDIDTIHACVVDENLPEPYTEEDSKKDLAIVYVQTGVKLAKLYTPSVALGILSMGAILTSNNILRKRNVALAAAYATVDKGFKEYRNRVVERFGDEVDRELRYNLKAKKIEEIVVDEETGKEKKVKKTVNVVGVDGYSTYARFFDVGNPNWEKNPDYNFLFLRSQQSYWNDKLRIKKRVFLNEVYESLGIESSKEGQIVGWTYDGNGDNYIDFGIYEYHREVVRDFIDGHERTILLDFNVDGNVWDSM